MEKSSLTYFEVIKKLAEVFRSSPFQVVKRVVLAGCLTLMVIGLNLLNPIIFKNLIGLLPNPELSTQVPVGYLLIGYGLCFVSSYLIVLFRSFVIFSVLEDCFRALSLRFVEHVLSLPMGFHTDKKTGAVSGDVSRLQTGFESVFWGVFLTLIPFCIEVTIVISVIGWIHGWFCGLALCVLLGCYGLLHLRGSKKLTRAQEVYYEKRSFAGGKIVDSLLNFETIKSFTNEEREYAQIDKAYEEQGIAGKRRARADLGLQFVQTLIIGAAFIFITWVSGRAVYRQNLSLGSFVLVNGYLLQLVLPLTYVGYVISQIRRGLHDIRSAFSLFLLKPEPKNLDASIKLSSKQLEVRFENVFFGYHPDKPILKDLSFSVLPGNKTAIVGSTGSGKSTIMRLLFRFYDVDAGSITINGRDIRHLSPKELRQSIGLVSQDTSLFNESLYANIAYGNPDASHEEIKEAIRMAELDALVDSLPDGYDTQVGERGLKLSGGEKQRVAIARVIVKKPALFIFDEATSALDSVTEKNIQKNLDEIAKGSTTIVIAHRLSTIRNADHIVLLSEGKVVECGEHDALVANSELYSRFYSADARI